MQHPRVAIVDYMISIDLYTVLLIFCMLSLFFTRCCSAVLLRDCHTDAVTRIIACSGTACRIFYEYIIYLP